MSAQSSSAGPIPWNKFLEKAACSQCGEPIEKGEDRVVVLAVGFEHPEEDPEGTPARRGASTSTTLCTVCCGEDPVLQLRNPWWEIRQSRADPIAVKHPGDDATLVSVEDVEKADAEKLYGKKVHGKHRGAEPAEPLPPAEEERPSEANGGFSRLAPVQWNAQ